MSFRDIPNESPVKIVGTRSLIDCVDRFFVPATAIIAGGITYPLSQNTIAMIRYYQSKGKSVIILYSGNEFEAELNLLPNITVVNNRNCVYKPFGGMNKNSVTTFINKACEISGHKECEGLFTAYTDILEAGGDAVTYLNLKTLINSDIEVLKKHIRTLGLSRQAEMELIVKITQTKQPDSAFKSVMGIIDSGLGGISAEYGESTNILETVAEGGSIAIRIDSGNPEILQAYLYEELNQCSMYFSDFVTVNFETVFTDKKLEEMFTSNARLPYKLVTGRSIRSLFTDNEAAFKGLLSSTGFLLILNGLNADSASEYAKLFPEIYTVVINEGEGFGRGFLHLMPDHHNTYRNKTKVKEHAVPGRVIADLKPGQAIFADFSSSGRYLAIKRLVGM